MQPDGPLDGVQVREYLDDTVAVTESEGGRATVVAARAPIAVRGEDGRRRRVDTTLSPEAGRFVPRRTWARYQLARDARDGFEFAGLGVAFRPVGAAASRGEIVSAGSEGRWEDSQVVGYPGIDTDTDLALRAVPSGVQTMHVLRSARAPERLQFDAVLPEGWALENLGGAVEVRDREKNVRGIVSPPVARDAAGEPVPARLDVKGDRVSIDVPHRAEVPTARYPVFVDPTFAENYPWTTGTSSFAAWQYGEWEPGFDGPFAGQWRGFPGTLNGNIADPDNGLWSYYQSSANAWGANTASINTFTQWNVRAPASGTAAQRSAEGAYVFKGDMGGASWSLRNVEASAPWPDENSVLLGATAGIWSAATEFASNNHRGASTAGGTRSDSPYPYANGGDSGYQYVVVCLIANCDAGGGTASAGPESISPSVAPAENYFVFGITNYRTGARLAGYQGRMFVGSAWVQMYDRGAPRATGAVRNMAEPDPQLSGLPTWQASSVRVEATGQDFGLGVRRLRVLGAGGAELRSTPNTCGGLSRNADGTANPPCGATQNSFWDIPAASLGDGQRSLKTQAVDVTDRTADADVTAYVDTTAPEAQWADGGGARDVEAGQSLTVTAEATDRHAGLRRTRLLVNGTLLPGSEQTENCSARVTQQCPQTQRQRTYDVAPDRLPPGEHTIRFEATDALGHTRAIERTVTVRDTIRPEATLSGSVTEQPLTGRQDRELTVAATDAGSGVRRIEASIDGEALPASPVERACATVCDPKDLTHTFAVAEERLDFGPHRIAVKVTDAAGNVRELSRTIFVTLPEAQIGNLFATPRVGFEDWWTYDTTETGGGGQLRANLGTGSAVWSKTVLENPGRGLGTFLRLTYNSNEPTRFPLLSGYDQAGRNVSVQLAGITRLNEPLIVDPVSGDLLLVDGDGTRHRFDGDPAGIPGQRSWTSPPGVHLRFRDTPLDANNPNSGPTSDRAIIATRADGTTYEFDATGFLQRMVDRNGNALRFEYEPFDPLGDGPGTVGELLSGRCGLGLVSNCTQRVKRVWDAPAEVDNGKVGARAWTLSYDTAGRLSEVRDRRCADGAATCAESDRRRATLDYTADRLTAITEAAGSDAEAGSRVTRLDYAPTLGRTDLLTGIHAPTAPNASAQGQVTRVGYRDVQDGTVAPLPTTQQAVSEITDRRQNATYTNVSAPQTGPQQRGDTTRTFVIDPEVDENTASTAQVTDARGNTTGFVMDGRDRMTELTDAVGTTFTQGWDDAVNQVSERVDAANRGDQAATTGFAWGPLGQLQSTTDPLGRSTTFSYRSGKGTVTDGTGDGGADDWVYDLTKVERPNGRSEESYDLDGAGNVVRQAQADGPTRWFERDQFGQVTREVREVAADTEDLQPNTSDGCSEVPPAPYADETGNARVATCLGGYDENGMPQVQVDERGQTWRTAYDSVGNRLAIADPRNTGQGTPQAGEPYTASWTYDQLDRRTRASTPKLSGGQGGSAQFVSRAWSYDPRDNELSYTDGTGATFTKTYDAVDQVLSSATPAVSHAGESQPAPEVERYEYDESGNRVLTRSPNNETAGGASSLSWSTQTVFDALDRPVVEREHNSQPEPEKGRPSVLVRSRAYDYRDNVVAETDPMGTAAAAGDRVPEQAAASSAQYQRKAWRYDLADQQVREIEAPSTLGLVTARAYDENGNVAVEVSPRGEVSANPAGGDERGALSANAYATISEYDARDELVEQDAPGYRRPDGSDHQRRVTRWERRLDGQVRAIESPRGSATSTEGDFTARFAYQPSGEMRWRTEPQAQGQYGSLWRTTYGVNQVGDPVSVVDARGNTILSAFYDTGELRSTNRAGWWIYDEQAGEIRERTPEDPDPKDDRDDLPSGGEAQGDFGDVEPQPLPDALPAAGRVERVDYDGEMRLTGVTGPWRRAVPADDTFDEAKRTTTWEYDATGRRTREVVPLETTSSGAPSTSDGVLNGVQRTWSYDRNGQMRAFVDGQGNRTAISATSPASEAQRAAFRTSVDFDQFGRRIAVDSPGSARNPSGAGQEDYRVRRQVTAFEHDLNGNETRTILPTSTTQRPVVETSRYDEADRNEGWTDPEGNSWEKTLDREGNVTRQTDPRENAETSIYDPAGEKVRSTDAAGQVSEFEYDRNANRTLERTPGSAPASGESVQSRQVRRTFDGRDLEWTTVQGAGSPSAEDPSDRPRATVREYDGLGNLVREVKPAGVQRVGDDVYRPRRAFTDLEATVTPTDTSFENAEVRRYSDDGLMQERLLPYDDERGDALTGGGEACPSTPAGIRAQSVARVDLDGDGTCETRQRWRQRFEHGPGGEVLAISTVGLFTQAGQTPPSQSRYARNAAGWVTRFSTVTDAGTPGARRDDELFYDYDRQGNQTLWCSNTGNVAEGRCARGADSTVRPSVREVRRSFYPSGELMQRCAVRKTPGGTVQQSRTYRYGYDERGDMLRMQDLNPPSSTSSDAPCVEASAGTAIADPGNLTPRTTLVSRDRAGRERDIDEQWQGGRDTRYGYTDHLRTGRWTDGTIQANGGYAGGKRTTLTYDALDRNTKVEVAGSQATGADSTRTTDISYWASGQRRTTTKPRNGNGNRSQETRYYDDKGQIVRRDRTSGADRTYAYDVAGNRTRDEKGTYRYNARDQLVRWERSGTPSRGKPTVTNEYAPLGGGVQRLVQSDRRDVNGATTTRAQTTTLSELERDRVSASRTVGTLTATAGSASRSAELDEQTEFAYDQFGAQTDQRTERKVDDEVDGERTEVTVRRQTYDVFQRLLARTTRTETEGDTDEDDDGPAYCYDGLDRRDRRIDKVSFPSGGDRFAAHAAACANTPTGASARDYSYVGLSEQLARSVEPSGSTPGSVRAATYDYGADGMRLGRKTGEETQDATATAGFRAYDLDAQDTIVGLESEQAGEVGDADEYRYDPFGSPLNAETEPGQAPAEGELSDEARQNPFRFQGHYADADSGLYDMRARTYDPGQGRFLSQDVFQDPQADLALAADPITNDRYAFTGGNPVTRSEYDGHNPCGSGRDGRACAKGNQEKSKTGDTPQQNRVRPTPREVRRQDRIVAAANQQQQQAAAAQNAAEVRPAQPAQESAPAHNLRKWTGFRTFNDCAEGVSAKQGLIAGCRGPAFDGRPGSGRPDELENGIGLSLNFVPGCVGPTRPVCRSGSRVAREAGRRLGRGGQAPSEPDGSSRDDGNSRYLYHYTSERGEAAIRSSGKLNASTGDVRARYGNGQYFSDITPNSGYTRWQVARRLYGSPIKAGRNLDRAVKIDVSGLQIDNPQQHIYLRRGSQPLDVRGRIRGSSTGYPQP